MLARLAYFGHQPATVMADRDNDELIELDRRVMALVADDRKVQATRFEGVIRALGGRLG